MKPLKKVVHFIGIGGIGMSSLARWFLANGYRVSGSDAVSSEITNSLRKTGARIFIGHKPSNVQQNIEQAITSAAITPVAPGYKEYSAARATGAKVSSYSEALGRISGDYELVIVSGAHGKSTTTSLLALTLVAAGLDPTVIVGTKLREFKNSGFRNGKGKYFVLEADEHNAAFLNYHPTAAIITNIDKEHMDFYKNFKNVEKTFLKFIGNIKSGGVLVVNHDDRNLFSLKNEIGRIAKAKSIKIFWYGISDNKKVANRISSRLQIFGDHNISNALAVYELARALKIKEKNIFDTFRIFRGSWRRMEYKGQLRVQNSELKVNVYDDYAHHPTEIKATLAGMAQKWPKRPLICVFEPHQAKRLILLFKEFTEAFDDASALILLDLYKVKGRDSEMSQNITSVRLAESIQKHINRAKDTRLTDIIYIPSSKINDLKKTIQNIILRHSHNFPQDLHYIVVMMGAGDIYKLTAGLVK